MFDTTSLTLADRASHGVDPERLRMLGKKASLLFTEREMPLTDAVVQVVSDQSGLNREHVHRVTEFANGYAFDTLYKRASGSHRVINFEGGPADPAAVLQELNAVPMRGETKLAAYRPTPKFIAGLEGLEDAFQISKTASAGPADKHENPNRPIFELQEMLKSAQDQLGSRMASLYVEFESVTDGLYKEAKQAVLNGVSPAEISEVFKARSPHPNITKLALKRIAEKMDGDMIPAPPMRKLAGRRVVNSNHPLCGAFDGFAKVAYDYFATTTAAERINEQLRVADKAVREVLQHESL